MNHRRVQRVISIVFGELSIIAVSRKRLQFRFGTLIPGNERINEVIQGVDAMSLLSGGLSFLWPTDPVHFIARSNTRSPLRKTLRNRKVATSKAPRHCGDNRDFPQIDIVDHFCTDTSRFSCLVMVLPFVIVVYKTCECRWMFLSRI